MPKFWRSDEFSTPKNTINEFFISFLEHLVKNRLQTIKDDSSSLSVQEGGRFEFILDDVSIKLVNILFSERLQWSLNFALK